MRPTTEYSIMVDVKAVVELKVVADSQVEALDIVGNILAGPDLSDHVELMEVLETIQVRSISETIALCVNPECDGDPQTNQYEQCKGDPDCPCYLPKGR